MSSTIDTLPSWALSVMFACAQSAGKQDFCDEIDRVRLTRLLEDTGNTPAWYERFETPVRVKARSLTMPEEWVPVSLSAIDAIFGEGGALSRMYDRYEPREGQISMARAVAEALNNRQFLLAEAGTGVGKSLAYLVPCALWACSNNLPIVLSTNTRNLQSQLMGKDIPLVRRIVASQLPDGKRLEASVLKGRGNYLCLRRFGAFVEGGYEALPEQEALLFADLTAWAAVTHDGDLDTFRPVHARGDMGFIRSFGCRADECTNKKCRFYQRCFMHRARILALKSHLVIANHALVLAELTNPGTLLPPHAQIVFDEAHNLENAATTFFSSEINPIALYEVCQKIAPSRGREAGTVFQRARVEFLDKAVQDKSEIARITQLLADMRQSGVKLARLGKALFETLGSVMSKTPESTVRFRSAPDPTVPPLPSGQPALRREFCFGKAGFIPAEPFLPEKDICEASDAFANELSHALRLLEDLQRTIERYAPKKDSGEPNPYEDLSESVEALSDSISAFGKSLKAMLEGSDPDIVYWMARGIGADKSVFLTGAPLDIAEQMNRLLYASKSSIVFASATLRIRDDFAHLRYRLGLNLIEERDRLVEFVAQSPFDYPKQCAVAVADFLPDVARDRKQYELELSRLMFRLFTEARGRSLALFTSYEMMRACAERLEPFLKERGIDLLTQSVASSRDAMTETFRAQTRPTVLFGTQSFWEGVDVVGDALSVVVIARLPFESYGDPLFQARCEKIEREGGSSFAQLSVPQAVIRFRQGFGRLIRSRADRGIVVVADARILRKSYGTAFARSLPCNVEAFHSRSTLVDRLKDLLATAPSA